jgi:hypothetical protein
VNADFNVILSEAKDLASAQRLLEVETRSFASLRMTLSVLRN